jgi:hypothetical protein
VAFELEGGIATHVTDSTPKTVASDVSAFNDTVATSSNHRVSAAAV